MLAELSAKEAKDSFCQQVAPTVRVPGSFYLYGRLGILVCRAQLNGAVKQWCKISFVHASFTSLIIRYWWDTPTCVKCTTPWGQALLAANGQKRFLDNRKFLPLHQKLGLPEEKTHYRTVPDQRALGTYRQGCIGPVAEIDTWDQFIVFIADCYTKLSQAIPSSTSTSLCHMLRPFSSINESCHMEYLHFSWQTVVVSL